METESDDLRGWRRSLVDHPVRTGLLAAAAVAILQVIVALATRAYAILGWTEVLELAVAEGVVALLIVAGVLAVLRRRREGDSLLQAVAGFALVAALADLAAGLADQLLVHDTSSTTWILLAGGAFLAVALAAFLAGRYTGR